ncbi:apolipoprotein A-Ib [Larimichthys crocea]|uniref:Apolipoprotein A-I n=1 Tax=Larimichthys crocea TaxID=215358 RepID=A0A0F8AGW3_LARCR|nr:apolipoprotein A-I [Larimichthys crocea]
MDSSLIEHYKKSVLAEVLQSRQELHQTTIMKFVALTLALLLAVGSQAASLPDPPTQLAHVRAAADLYLTQLKESANRALAQLDDTEYKEIKDSVSQHIENFHTQLKALQAQVSPVTDSVVSTISDATADLRTSLIADLDQLKADIEPKRVALRAVIEKHLDEYKTELEPIMKEYYVKHTNDMAVLKEKLEPVVESLQAKVSTNLEETKAALAPIVETVRAKLSERLEALKQLATPYVEEYKEQLKNVYTQAQGADGEALKAKIAPLADDIKSKLQAIFQIITASVTKN